MHHHDITPGSQQPGVDGQEVQQVINEAGSQPITLAGCLHIVPVELPYAVGQLHPLCSRITEYGAHPIPSPYVWKDLDSNEVFCHLRCAAKEAVDRASRIAKDEGIYPAEVLNA